MNSEDSIKYTVYELWSYFSEPPGELLCCPVCESPISIKTIGQSKAVSKYYRGHTPFRHEAYVFKCKSCPWWAVREGWAEYETKVDPDYAIVGEIDDNQEGSPWLQVLENEHLYEKPLPLPERIGKWFSHGKRRKQTTSEI
jgi:hypothetical protein